MEFSVTLTAKLIDWALLRRQMKDSGRWNEWPMHDLIRMIDDLTSQAEKAFYPKEVATELKE